MTWICECEPHQLLSGWEHGSKPLRILMVTHASDHCPAWAEELRRAGWIPEWQWVSLEGEEFRRALARDWDLIVTDVAPEAWAVGPGAVLRECGCETPVAGDPERLAALVEQLLPRQQERDYLRALEFAPVAVLLADGQGQLLACNQAGYLLLGYDKQDFLALRLLDLYPPAVHPRVLAAFQTLSRQGTHQGEYLVLRHDGEGVWVSLQAVKMTRGVCAIFLQNITERKLLDKQREELENQLRLLKKLEAVGQLAGGMSQDFSALFHQIFCHAAQIDSLDQRHVEHIAEIIQATERGADLAKQLVLFGQLKRVEPEPAGAIEPQFGPERPLRLLMVEDDEADAALILSFLKAAGYSVSHHRVDNREDMRKALESESWDAIIADHQMPQFSGGAALELYQQMGHDIPFLVASGKIGEETAIEYMKAGAHDYLFKGNLSRLAPALRRELAEASTRRAGREAEEARRESQARYQQIVEAGAEGIFIVDTRLRVTFCNRRLGEMLGCSPESILGNSLFAYVVPEDAPMARERWRSRPVDGVERPMDLRFVRGDSGVVWTQVSVSQFNDRLGNWVGTLGMVTDITERRLLQERILLTEVEKKRFCRQVLQAVTRGKFHLVDLAELPGPGEVLLEVPLDGEAPYRRLLQQVRDLGQEQGLDAETSADFALAVGEAATNALKHARDGCAQISQLDGRITVRITDHGDGIRAEDLPASILQAGFSTAVSLGMGYTLMLEMSDTVWLASGPDGTVVQLEKSLTPPARLDDFSEQALLDRFG